ncbi:unnamed protein product [Choristocarpus tenellus]
MQTVSTTQVHSAHPAQVKATEAVPTTLMLTRRDMLGLGMETQSKSVAQALTTAAVLHSCGSPIISSRPLCARGQGTQEKLLSTSPELPVCLEGFCAVTSATVDSCGMNKGLQNSHTPPTQLKLQPDAPRSQVPPHCFLSEKQWEQASPCPDHPGSPSVIFGDALTQSSPALTVHGPVRAMQNCSTVQTHKISSLEACGVHTSLRNLDSEGHPGSGEVFEEDTIQNFSALVPAGVERGDQTIPLVAAVGRFPTDTQGSQVSPQLGSFHRIGVQKCHLFSELRLPCCFEDVGIKTSAAMPSSRRLERVVNSCPNSPRLAAPAVNDFRRTVPSSPFPFITQGQENHVPSLSAPGTFPVTDTVMFPQSGLHLRRSETAGPMMSFLRRVKSKPRNLRLSTRSYLRGAMQLKGLNHTNRQQSICIAAGMGIRLGVVDHGSPGEILPLLPPACSTKFSKEATEGSQPCLMPTQCKEFGLEIEPESEQKKEVALKNEGQGCSHELRRVHIKGSQEEPEERDRGCTPGRGVTDRSCSPVSSPAFLEIASEDEELQMTAKVPTVSVGSGSGGVLQVEGLKVVEEQKKFVFPKILDQGYLTPSCLSKNEGEDNGICTVKAGLGANRQRLITLSPSGDSGEHIPNTLAPPAQIDGKGDGGRGVEGIPPTGDCGSSRGVCPTMISTAHAHAVSSKEYQVQAQMEAMLEAEGLLEKGGKERKEGMGAAVGDETHPLPWSLQASTEDLCLPCSLQSNTKDAAVPLGNTAYFMPVPSNDLGYHCNTKMDFLDSSSDNGSGVGKGLVVDEPTSGKILAGSLVERNGSRNSTALSPVSSPLGQPKSYEGVQEQVLSPQTSFSQQASLSPSIFLSHDLKSASFLPTKPGGCSSRGRTGNTSSDNICPCSCSDRGSGTNNTVKEGERDSKICSCTEINQGNQRRSGTSAEVRSVSLASLARPSGSCDINLLGTTSSSSLSRLRPGQLQATFAEGAAFEAAATALAATTVAASVLEFRTAEEFFRHHLLRSGIRCEVIDPCLSCYTLLLL